MVGYLLNPVPLVFQVDPQLTIDRLASTASATIAPCLPHRTYPFAKIVTDARNRNEQPPSGRVLVSYSDDPAAELAGLPVTQRMLFNGHAVADISFFVEPRSDHVNLGVEFNGQRVRPEIAHQILDRFDHAFAAAITGDELAIADLPSIPSSVLIADDLDSEASVLAQFIRHAAENPHAPAVRVGDRTLTAGQLAARASQLARELDQHGVGTGDRVAVRMSRSPELAIAVLGVLFSGASYVPIDPTYPRDRIAANLTQSGATVEVTDQSNSTVPNAVRCSETGLDGNPWDDTAKLSGPLPGPTAEAYVIFTSGSTGAANGVPITHRQLARSTNARASFYNHAPSAFLMVSSVAFDSSIVGLFWSFASGATLVLPTDDAAHDVDALALLATTEISHLLCVPTLYEALLDRRDSSASWPETVIVAGEACTPALVTRHFNELPASGLTNEYGPTEASVWATAHHCSPDDRDAVPIGQPIAGTWLAVVGPSGAVLPHGVEGELVLGGANVAAGYLATSSADRFGDATEIDGLPEDCTGPIFRTGDSCRISNRTLHFSGRIDDQLNVGGARVEPAEVERLLAKVRDVKAVVVVAGDLRQPDATRADTQLVAHYSGPAPIERSDMLAELASLPSTHRPRIFVHHDALPVLPNGKLDRSAAAALPLPRTTPTALPSGDLLGSVQQLFAEVLHIDAVASDQSFFDLGGDSLRALELLRLIEARMGVRLPTSAVHNSPSAQELAALCSHAETGLVDANDNTIVMKLQPKGDRTPIFALHNLGVDGAMWRPLSGYLGDDHPMYGIADPYALLDPFGDSYKLEHRPEISETAARYVQHIQQLAPTGPVILLGFCVGGVLGYEVAQQLAAAGRPVQNFIIVLDWHAPHLEYEENFITMTRLSYRRSGKSLPTYLHGLLTRRAFVKSLRRRAEGYMVKGVARLNLPMNDRLRARQYVEEGIHRIHSYEYLPYAGRITIVRSTEDPRIPADLGTAGWGDLVGDLEVEYVPGIGERMLYEPNIAAVSEVVRRALEPR